MLKFVASAGLLLAATSIGAVERSQDEFSQVLLFPYFSANGELSTVASVSRTLSLFDIPVSNGGPNEAPLAISVVVKLDDGNQAGTIASEHFTVILSTRASWNFTLSMVEGRTALTTDSNTCAFRSDAPLTEGSTAFLSDGSEGWIEIFALGTVKGTQNLGSLLQARQCSEVAALVADLPAAEWLDPAGNVLRGAAHLVDVPSGTSYSLPTVGLKNFANVSVRSGFDDLPVLADVTPPVASVVSSGGERMDSTFAEHPIDAVSAVLMDSDWEIDFTSDPNIAARTDLVITAPTRQWYVDIEAARAPFASNESPIGAVPTRGRLHDRSGGTISIPGASKCTPPPLSIQQRGPVIGTSLVVVQFAPQSALQSQRLFEMPHRPYDSATCVGIEAPVWERIVSGRLALRFDVNPSSGIGGLISDEGHEFLGLPIIGAGLTKAVNGNVGGNVANFGLVQSITRTPGHPQSPSK